MSSLVWRCHIIFVKELLEQYCMKWSFLATTYIYVSIYIYINLVYLSGKIQWIQFVKPTLTESNKWLKITFKKKEKIIGNKRADFKFKEWGKICNFNHTRYKVFSRNRKCQELSPCYLSASPKWIEWVHAGMGRVVGREGKSRGGGKEDKRLMPL